MTHPALLWDRLPSGQVRCRTCQWFCRISNGHNGVCGVYHNREGALENLNYALVSSLAVDPIEKKPLYHFHPGTTVFSLGSWGCNFHCAGCQNWEIACPEGDDWQLQSREISPEQAVDMAIRAGSAGIACTYNEPSVWLEYALDTARLARAAGLYTVYVTNGYASEEQLDAVGPWLDAWRVDIKGFTDATYRRIARVRQFEGILRVAERARHKWGMHIEVVTNIIPGLSDDDAQLQGIAGWIAGSLGVETPWHLTRFFPRRNMTEGEATSVETLERARAIGLAAGLRFVYLGNVTGGDSGDTVCFNCHRRVVKRSGFSASVTGLEGGSCRYCGTALNFRR